MSDNPSNLLEEADLAKRWAVTTRTLYNLRRQGKTPPHVPIGGKRMYRLQDVEAFEESLLEKPEAKTEGDTGE